MANGSKLVATNERWAIAMMPDPQKKIKETNPLVNCKLVSNLLEADL